jgi:hypothetical protein
MFSASTPPIVSDADGKNPEPLTTIGVPSVAGPEEGSIPATWKIGVDVGVGAGGAVEVAVGVTVDGGVGVKVGGCVLVGVGVRVGVLVTVFVTVGVFEGVGVLVGGGAGLITIE